jgi:hypothetical protein
MLSMKERLEDSISEAKCQQVLYRFLAKIMVDPIDLIGPKKTQEVAIEGDGTGEIVAEWLLDDDAGPGAILFSANQARAAKPSTMLRKNSGSVAR